MQPVSPYRHDALQAAILGFIDFDEVDEYEEYLHEVDEGRAEVIHIDANVSFFLTPAGANAVGALLPC